MVASNSKMTWGTKEGQLLCPKRLVESETKPGSEERTPYQRDYDRIIFSSAFRRLQGKAQVFPLSSATSDYVRTRLTHSLEAASVGRSLGTLIGEHIVKKYTLDLFPADIGTIVSAACLAHDIGNPPFGHQGEKAFQNYFDKHQSPQLGLVEQQYQGDFLRFEGNAQGFRVLTRLVQNKYAGGMRLTSAILATFTKYPRGSYPPKNPPRYIGEKKHGFFEQDRDTFESVARNVGLIERERNAWCRHPLAFLVEAADDICYRIVDIKDAASLGLIELDEAFSLLKGFTDDEGIEKRFRESPKEKKRESIEYLRAKAIGALIDHSAKRFIANEEQIVQGLFDEPLIEDERIKPFKEVLENKVLNSRIVAEIEAAGYQILDGLLHFFVPAVLDHVLHQDNLEPRSKALLKLVPEHFRHELRGNKYDHIIGITDFVSGMTDSFAVSLFRRISGITI